MNTFPSVYLDIKQAGISLGIAASNSCPSEIQDISTIYLVVETIDIGLVNNRQILRMLDFEE